MTAIQSALPLLNNDESRRLLGQLNRGLEKESLRVSPSGVLAQTSHPHALGSALTHPSITTDFSEALLEFVTPVHRSIDDLLEHLNRLHCYAYQNIGDEKLWVNSMPCVVEGEDHIEIARFGSSHVAKMKETYRMGLSYRYGRLMQTIAGIHFNFSLPEAFWPHWADKTGQSDVAETRNNAYFSLIRNYHRHSGLLIYLFGASPAVCRSFLRGREHDLENFGATSFYAPHATSLRLSGLGYSNDAQASIAVCYNEVDSFTKSLNKAISTPYPAYQDIGVVVDDEYRQLNANLLQIENEFYAGIRPKQVANSGESPSKALLNRGVQYVEVRSLDLNPFHPLGIDEQCIRFIDVFLLWCMFEPSAQLAPEDHLENAHNHRQIVMTGRQAGLQLNQQGQPIEFTKWATTIFDQLVPYAELLDANQAEQPYQTVVRQLRERIAHPELTPSAAIVSSMQENDWSFYEFAMHWAETHEQSFKSCELDAATKKLMQQISQQSHVEQRAIEDADQGSFAQFLDDYFSRNQIS